MVAAVRTPQQAAGHNNCNITVTVSFLSQMVLALSAKAFSVRAPSVRNSLSHNCRSAKLLCTFKSRL